MGFSLNKNTMHLSLRNILLKIWRTLPQAYWLRFSIQRLFIQNFLVGVAGAIFNQAGKILLFKHSYRKEYPWGLPSGWLKKGEQPGEALIREIKEETGWDARIVRPLFVKADDVWSRLDVIFICEMINSPENRTFTPSYEVIEAKFYATTALPLLMPSQKRIILEAYEQLEKNVSQNSQPPLHESELNMIYPILEYDSTREAFIEPSKVNKPLDIPDSCVICFFKDVINKVVEEHNAKVLVENAWEDGPHPVYEIEYKGQRM